MTAVLGRAPLQGAITGVDAGNTMRSFVGRVVDMASFQIADCSTTRDGRWPRRSAMRRASKNWMSPARKIGPRSLPLP